MIPGLAAISKLPPWTLLGFGLLAGYLRSAWNTVYQHTIGHLLNRISITLSVEDCEHWDAYTWLSFWAEKNLRDRRISSLLLQRRGAAISESESHPFGLIPHYGSYYMRWKRRPLVITHSKQSAEQALKPRRTMEIRVWFTNDREILLGILEQARQEYILDNPDGLRHFTGDGYSEWLGSPITHRPLESLFLPEDLLADIVATIQTWLTKEEAYRSLSIPYQLSLLLYGEPGTGKTSTIKGLASKFRLPIYSLSFDKDMTAYTLRSLLRRCGGPCIVLLEDFDCIPIARDRDSTEKAPESKSDLTLSDLLNAIDGIGASEKRLIIMTTNKPEIIDPALLRSGRVDHRWYFTYAAETELRRFYDRARELFNLPDWETFRSRLPEKCTISDAQAQAIKGLR